MSRITNQIANLNTVDDADGADKQNDADLKMFSNTTFFDLDIGRSTDIATTVDELLMQQEKQIQYPYKQQPLDDNFDGADSASQPAPGPVAGPSYSQPSQPSLRAPAHHQRQPVQHPYLQQQHQQQQLPFDFSTLQEFSLAGELPQTSLSIYDVDPVFHEQAAQPAARTQGPATTPATFEHQSARQTPMQRHELADAYAPKNEASTETTSALLGEDDEKRRRNTAASARFRVKKKQREQEMEKNQRLMQKQITEQAERIKQLEMENSWLKSLVVEKNTARDSTYLGKLRSELLDQ